MNNLSFVQESLSDRDFLNSEDWGWLVDNLGSILANDFENGTHEFRTAPAIQFRRALTFCLLVEEPFIDFDPL